MFGEALGAGADPILLGALLASMATRGEDVAEIAGAADALRAAMIPFDHPFPEAIDTCGTGATGWRPSTSPRRRRSSRRRRGRA